MTVFVYTCDDDCLYIHMLIWLFVFIGMNSGALHQIIYVECQFGLWSSFPVCQPLYSNKGSCFSESLPRLPRSASDGGCDMKLVRWSPRRYFFLGYLLVLWLYHGQHYCEVLSLTGAGDEAVQACTERSEVSYIRGTSWARGDIPNPNRFYDPCHSIGWSKSSGKGYVMDYKEIHFLVLQYLSSASEPPCWGATS